MCGINGLLKVKEAKMRLKLGAKELTHRGPDEEGRFDDSLVSLGIQRLSIIDLTKELQPVYSESREVVAVMNGEIYNHIELSELLQKSGHILASGTDTEVLPHLYEEYGDTFITKLRGMFSLALWDKKRERLLLVRDRFGKKPL